MIADDTLLMFFYGTLKRGGRNHEAYCRGAVAVEEATVCGRLYELPAGYPALLVLQDDIMAVGSSDHRRDAEACRLRPRAGSPGDEPAVFGELFAFDDPAARLPALDLLEEFVPGDASSPYRRVLVPAAGRDGALRSAWSYAVDEPAGRYLPGGRWPAGRGPF